MPPYPAEGGQTRGGGTPRRRPSLPRSWNAALPIGPGGWTSAPPDGRLLHTVVEIGPDVNGFRFERRQLVARQVAERISRDGIRRLANYSRGIGQAKVSMPE